MESQDSTPISAEESTEGKVPAGSATDRQDSIPTSAEEGVEGQGPAGSEADSPDSAPVLAEGARPPAEKRGRRDERVDSPGGAISWRRDLIAVLVAGAAFLVLLTLGSVLPILIWLGGVVFLPAGVWVGRESRSPWVDGAIYGFLAALAAFLALFSSGFGILSGLLALFLAVPQGILGAWLGARFWPARDGTPAGRPPAS